MATSTNGEISYGFLFEEGYKFPWDREENESCMSEWYMAVTGWKPTPEIYTPDGTDYLPGVTEEMKNQYFNHREAHRLNNPIPVDLVNVCSLDSPIYILAIAESVITAYRGTPKSIDPFKLNEYDTIAWNKILADFCIKYDIDIPGNPSWYLSSYWG